MGSYTVLNLTTNTTAIATSGGGEAFVLADDTEGQEIFCANWRTSADSNQHYVYIFKNTAGNWTSISDVDASRTSNSYIASYNSSSPLNYDYTISGSIVVVSSMVTMIKQPVWAANPGSAAADPFASFDYVKPASTRLYVCSDTNSFRPIYRGDNTTLDIIQMVSYYAFDITGIA